MNNQPGNDENINFENFRKLKISTPPELPSNGHKKKVFGNVRGGSSDNAIRSIKTEGLSEPLNGNSCISPSLSSNKPRFTFAKTSAVETAQTTKPKPTKLAYDSHRELVTDVKKFICAPVPPELGTLECSLVNYYLPARNMFGSPTQVWELRITDERVKYDGFGKFTNVPEASGVGVSPNGPQLGELCKNRLVVVAERKTRGIVNKTHSYLFSMASCSQFHDYPSLDDNYLIGKMECLNYWGTEFTGYDLSEKFGSVKGDRTPIKKEILHIKYDVSLGNPRQILAGIPRPKQDTRCEDNDKQDIEGLLWKSSIPPELDEDLDRRVVPMRGTKNGKLSKAMETYDNENVMCYHNRKPVWDESIETHVLDFGGRVTEASVKNFQLDESLDETENQFINYDMQ
eukprot:CAMPEP_0203752442 /NCGR_PEP_ID=MMETSP0098-20131031/6375_1 /ASSEMBLY_ACC=CAM_ASM_000208 /TAXON_ID=96639 /ORGANISM=" , Strain NY0313808BC1" /LENGTH=399 /DNA_ID=CAMNT_0050642617 /DNA_START=85 /DNA_END=1281 /DNA_ORIENTATION=+